MKRMMEGVAGLGLAAALAGCATDIAATPRGAAPPTP